MAETNKQEHQSSIDTVLDKDGKIDSSGLASPSSRAYLEYYSSSRSGLQTIIKDARGGYRCAVYVLGELGHYDRSILKLLRFRREPNCVITALDALRKLNHYSRRIYRVLDYDGRPLTDIEDEDWDVDWESRHVGVTLVALETLAHFGHYRRVIKKVERHDSSYTYLSYLSHNVSSKSAKKLLRVMERRGIKRYNKVAVALLYQKANLGEAANDKNSLEDKRSWPFFGDE